MRTRARTPRARAHPPEHPEHPEHMNRNKDLGRSEVSEHADGARNALVSVPRVEHLAAFARRLGVNRSTVTRAAQAGRLVLDAQGMVLVAPSLERWHATRGTRDDVAARHAAARGAEVPALSGAVAASVAGVAHPATVPAAAPQQPAGRENEAGEGAEPAADVSGAQRAAAEADRLHWQNQLLELALALTRGTRLPRQALTREAQALGNSLRGAVERLIDQTAPRLAAVTNAAERRRLLQGELAAARRQLRAEFARSIRRLRPDGTVSTVAAAAAAEPSPEPQP